MKTNYMNAKQQLFAITLSVATIISLAWISPDQTEANVKVGELKKIINTVKSTKMVPQETKLSASDQQCAAPCDTTKKKKKFKILTVDAQGNQQEYNSINEMPDSLKKEVIQETFGNNSHFPADLSDTFKGLSMRFKSISKDSLGNIIVHSPKMTEVYVNQLRLHAEAMANQAKITDATKRAIEVQIKGMEIAKAYSKAVEANVSNSYKSEDNKKLQLELKEQMEKVKEFHNSTEYKKLKNKFEADLQKIIKRKRIATNNNNTFNYNSQYQTDEAPLEIRELRIDTN